MSDLTEKWKAGELKEGWYYILNQNNTVRIEEANVWIGRYEKPYIGFYDDSGIKEILTPVPSYEELQSLEADRLAKNEGEEIVAELKEENARLKELLKEWVKAYPVVAVTCDLKNFVKIKELLDKTNEALK